MSDNNSAIQLYIARSKYQYIMFTLYLSVLTVNPYWCMNMASQEAANTDNKSERNDISPTQIKQLEYIESSSFAASAISKDGKMLLIGDWTNFIRLYNMVDNKIIRSFKPCPFVKSLAFSNDDKYIISGHRELNGVSTAILWSVDTGAEICRYKGNSADISSVCISSGNVITGSNNICIWEFGKEKLLRQQDVDAPDIVMDILDKKGESLAAIVHGPDKDTHESKIRIYNINKNKNNSVFSGPVCSMIMDVSIVPTDDMLLVLYNKATNVLYVGPQQTKYYVMIIDTSNGKVLYDKMLPYIANTINCLPSGKQYVIAGRDVYLWGLYDK